MVCIWYRAPTSWFLQVIRHLNTKGAEDSCNLQEAAGEYEVEIEQILQTTAEKVSAFNKQLALQQEESRITSVIKVTTIHCKMPSSTRFLDTWQHLLL